MLLTCRPSRLNKRYCRLVNLAIFLSLLVCMIFMGFTRNTSPQAPRNSRLCLELVRNLCDSVRRGYVTGNLCPKICAASFSQFQCLRLANEGKVVLLFTEGHENIVLKTKSLHMYKQQYPPDNEVQAYESAEALKNSLRNQAERIFTSKEPIEQFLSHVITQTSDVQASLATGNYLLDQREYILLLELQHTYTVPALIGACGSVYGTQYTPTDDALLVNNIWSGLPWRSVGPWDRRRAAAIAIIELANRLDNLKRSFCDVKGENFGLLEDGRAVLLDVDSLFTDKELADTLKMDACSSDSDCLFWDCHGECNLDTGKCSGELSNTNFHAVCQKIFLHHSHNAFHGLLIDVPHKRSGIVQEINSWCSHYKITKARSKQVMKYVRKELIHDRILG